MKLKRIIRIISILVIVSILSSLAAFAAPMRASDYLSVYGANLTRTSDGNVSIYFRVTAPKKLEHLGVSKINVQRYNGSYWQPQYPSSEYRAVLTFYGADSTGSDTGVYTT